MTTTVKDTSMEVAGRRLNPQVLPEWQLLLTHIEISEGFSFVVLLVPDADWADACRLALSDSLDALDKSLLTIDFSGSEDFKVQLPGRLLNLNISDRTGAVWLEKTVSEASPYFTEWQDAWHGMVARLNQFRNPLRRHFQVPLVFVGANWIQPLIRQTAPDLWSIRTLVTRIRPPEPVDLDSLTGLANRRHFREVLACELERWRRYRAPCALLMLDIDHLELVNDKFGHPVGDNVIRQIAETLKEVSRDNDTAARLGGEEFVLLLPGVDLNFAVSAAERLRKVLSNKRLEGVGTVTVSIGVAGCPESATSERELYAASDKALGVSKNSGCDRVSVAPPLQETRS